MAHTPKSSSVAAKISLTAPMSELPSALLRQVGFLSLYSLIIFSASSTIGSNAKSRPRIEGAKEMADNAAAYLG